MDNTAPSASRHRKLSEGPTQEALHEDAEAKLITPEVLHALGNGDPDAFKLVYLHYVTPIRDFITTLIRSTDDAEEIAHDILLNLWENREKVDPEKNIKSYLFTIARNAALDYFRRKQVHQRYAAEQLHHSDTNFSEDGILHAKESEILVRIAFNRMPPQRKKVFEMSRGDGLTYEQIAKKLKISRKAVEYHVSAALKEIKKILTFCLVLTVCISAWIYYAGI